MFAKNIPKNYFRFAERLLTIGCIFRSKDSGWKWLLKTIAIFNSQFLYTIILVCEVRYVFFNSDMENFVDTVKFLYVQLACKFVF